MELSDFSSIIQTLFPEPHASLLAGMLFGLKRTMPDVLYEQLVKTGTVHVIALSGMNVSIFVKIVFDMAGRFTGKYIAAATTIVTLMWFLFLVGPSATIVRAAIMAVCTVCSKLFGRKDIPLLGLVFAAGTMILVKPSIIGDISFQLSVAATLGILIFSHDSDNDSFSLVGEEKPGGFVKHVGRLVRHSWVSLKGTLASDLKTTLSAQLFTTPLIMYYFHQVSIISPVSNIAVGWLVGPIMILGLFTVTVGMIWLPLGKICSFLVFPFLTMFIVLVRLFASVPFGSFEF